MTIAAAVAIFAAAVVVSRVAFSDPADAEHLYALPIALAAVMLGRNAGITAGFIAFALVAAQRRMQGLEVDTGVAVSRMCAYMLLGWALGHFAERKRATQRVLAEAERGYQELLERVPAIVYTAEYGPDGTWPYVSPKIEPTLGYSVEEWVADASLWYQHLHPDDREQALVAEDRSRRTGEPLDSEYRMIARDGRVMWFRDQASVVHDEHGRSVMLHGVMLDITSRKRAEDELELRYAVQKRLAEAASLNEGLHGVLRTVAARFGWDVGAFWTVDDREDVLRLTDMWIADGIDGRGVRASQPRAPVRAAARACRGGRGRRASPCGSRMSWPTRTSPARSSQSGAGCTAPSRFPPPPGTRFAACSSSSLRSRAQPDAETLALLPAVSPLIADFVATRATIEEARAASRPCSTTPPRWSSRRTSAAATCSSTAGSSR